MCVCVCVCVCPYQFYHMRGSVQLWQQSTHGRVPSPQESLVLYFWNASHPVLLPTPPSPKPWRQESVLHFYSFVILIYLRRLWACFLCGALHGDGSRYDTTHVWPAVPCKPAHHHTLPAEWGVKAPVTEVSWLSPLLSTMISNIKCYSFCFHYQISFIKLKEEDGLLYAPVFLGFFFVVSVIPSSFLTLQNFFSPHFLSIWTFSFSQLLNIGLYVTNSFIFLSPGDVVISSSSLKDDFPEYETHGWRFFLSAFEKVVCICPAWLQARRCLPNWCPL